MEISDAVGIRIREDNKGNNKEDMDSKNLFFFKVYATPVTQDGIRIVKLTDFLLENESNI